MDSLEKDKIVAELLQAFNYKKIVLYIGMDTTEEEIQQIVRLPWICIITPRREEKFKTLFVNKNKKTREFVKYDELPSKIYDQQILSIVRLNGVENQEDEEDDEEIRECRREENYRKIWNYLIEKMDVSTQLVFMGYVPNNLGDISRASLILSFDSIRGGNLQFYGMKEDEESEKLKKTVLKRGYLWTEEKLSTLLFTKSNDLIEPMSGEVTDHIFWISGKAVALSDMVLLQLKETGTLLTEDLLYTIRPFGRIQQAKWFTKFLLDSAEQGPQWYGYLPQSEFYLRREYEDILFPWVKNILEGQENGIADYGEPIILEGDPGSSKSVVLAALAFHIFEEKQYPVIYVTKKDLNNRDFEILDEMMMNINETDVSNTKVLLVWDGSSYTNIEKTAKDMARFLRNRGRRFVLVCSAYHYMFNNDKVKIQGYKRNLDDRFQKCTESEEVRYSNECFYIHATRQLSSNEKVQLKNKVKLYCRSSAERILDVWGKLQDDGINDSFSYFYKLMVILQDPLKNNLKIEHSKICSYVQKNFDKMAESVPKEERSLSILEQALLDAGVELTEYDFSEVEDELESLDIEKLDTCVALFSRFKIDTPISLAFSVLNPTGNISELYNQLFKEVTSKIPWILYKINDEGDVCFVYRSQLEASIFLKNHCNITIENQVKMICDMIEFYQKEYKRFGSIDESIKEPLQKLLRMIGPNSDYLEFKNGDNQEHKEFLFNLEIIINKLKWLREDCEVPDEDKSFAIIEITFIREYYNCRIQELCKNSEDEEFINNYKECIEKISDASTLAYKCIDYLESLSNGIIPRNLKSQTINSLTVEVARCNIIINSFLEEHKENIKTNLKKTILGKNRLNILQYKQLYTMLLKAIYSDPQNGYSYNALFSLFEQEYESSRNDKKKQLHLLSEIQLVAEEADSIDVQNRGARKDELGEHLLFIKEKSEDTIVYIDDIINNTCPVEFGCLFNDMLREGNPAAICFVCRQELVSISHSDSNNIEKNLEKYKKIKKFLNDPKYHECVLNNSQSVFLLLKITWAFYAHQPLSKGECKLTNLSLIQWKEILEICEAYEKSDSIPKPIVSLIHALAVIQIRWDYEEAANILASLREDMFFGRRRTVVPYMICEKGKAKKYSGKVLYVDPHKMSRVRLDGIKHWKENSEKGILYPKRNFITRNVPEKGEVYDDLELGIGYMGFSLYTEKERRKKEERV